MFETDRFIADCREAGRASGPPGVLEVVSAAVTTPAEILHALGEPRRAGVNVLYRSPELTIINLIWGPQMWQLPHDHRMWAVIGIYGGLEQNTFYRRAEHGLEQHGSKELHAKDTTPLGAAIIHAVTNPLDQITAAIHVYGGDFFATPRSEWDPKTFEERPYDVEDTMRAFEVANERLRGKVPRS